MWTIIAYDVSADKARDRVAKRLLDDALRVQKSVFEAPHLDSNRFLRMRSDLEGLVDPATDSLRYYRLCRACARNIEHVGAGVGLLEPDPPYKILG